MTALRQDRGLLIAVLIHTRILNLTGKRMKKLIKNFFVKKEYSDFTKSTISYAEYNSDFDVMTVEIDSRVWFTMPTWRSISFIPIWRRIPFILLKIFWWLLFIDLSVGWNVKPNKNTRVQSKG